MNYIIVLPEGVLNSEQRANRISEELYNITAPIAIQQPYQHGGKVFGIIAHPDGVQHALTITLNYPIPVHPQATLEKLIALFTELTEAEIRALSSYVLNSQQFPFAAIIPSTTTVRDQEYMIENGWFPEDSEL